MGISGGEITMTSGLAVHSQTPSLQTNEALVIASCPLHIGNPFLDAFSCQTGRRVNEIVNGFDSSFFRVRDGIAKSIGKGPVTDAVAVATVVIGGGCAGIWKRMQDAAQYLTGRAGEDLVNTGTQLGDTLYTLWVGGAAAHLAETPFDDTNPKAMAANLGVAASGLVFRALEAGAYAQTISSLASPVSSTAAQPVTVTRVVPGGSGGHALALETSTTTAATSEVSAIPQIVMASQMHDEPPPIRVEVLEEFADVQGRYLPERPSALVKKSGRTPHRPHLDELDNNPGQLVHGDQGR